MKVVFDIQPNVADLNTLVRALCILNVRYLRLHPTTQTLRQAKVRYISQDVGCERLLLIPQVLQQGGGDCDQLAPARAAELQIRGVNAWPEVIRISEHLYHVFVRHPSGRAEDISAHLGMKVPPKLVAAGRDILKTALIRKLTGTQHGQGNRKRVDARRDRTLRDVRNGVSLQGWPWWQLCEQ